jgi:hypothetical protein
MKQSKSYLVTKQKQCSCSVSKMTPTVLYVVICKQNIDLYDIGEINKG